MPCDPFRRLPSVMPLAHHPPTRTHTHPGRGGSARRGSSGSSRPGSGGCGRCAGGRGRTAAGGRFSPAASLPPVLVVIDVGSHRSAGEMTRGLLCHQCNRCRHKPLAIACVVGNVMLCPAPSAGPITQPCKQAEAIERVCAPCARMRPHARTRFPSRTAWKSAVCIFPPLI